jgi:hypothetical protein
VHSKAAKKQTLLVNINNYKLNPSPCSWILLEKLICRGADKFLAFPIFSTTKIIFLGWVKEVRTTKS